jgi:trk system potassium uptake protein TrkA
MKIVILGAGAVGFHLARNLARDGHDIVVIDGDPAKVAQVDEQVDCIARVGNATSPDVLVKAEVGEADLVIAVTSVDEVNILACALAKVLGAKMRIARVRNQEFTRRSDLIHPERLGVDLIIHPEQEAAREIVRLLRHGYAFEHHVFENGRVHLAGVTPTEDSIVLGRTLAELGRDLRDFAFRIVAIDRDGTAITPTGRDKIELGDRVYVIALSQHVSKIGEIAGIKNHVSRNVMILGAGLVGVMVAKELEGDKRCNVKLIESSRSRSSDAADLLKEAIVVRGVGADVDLLAQEGITEMDAFIAATEDDELNVVCSLMARHLKVPRVITLVSKVEYLPIIRTIGLDVAINVQRLTSNAILTHIRQGQVISVAGTKGIPAEMIEFRLAATSPLVGKKLMDVKFPKGSVVGAHVRGDDVSIATGQTELAADDRLVVFTLPQAAKQVTKMFA